MFNNYLVEVSDNPVGILVRAGGAYAFHALDPSVRDMEGLTFPDCYAAEKAARKMLETGGRKRA